MSTSSSVSDARVDVLCAGAAQHCAPCLQAADDATVAPVTLAADKSGTLSRPMPKTWKSEYEAMLLQMLRKQV
eukprot:2160277-Pleurochrysis_carterae.AAC.3